MAKAIPMPHPRTPFSPHLLFGVFWLLHGRRGSAGVSRNQGWEPGSPDSGWNTSPRPLGPAFPIGQGVKHTLASGLPMTGTTFLIKTAAPVPNESPGTHSARACCHWSSDSLGTCCWDPWAEGEVTARPGRERGQGAAASILTAPAKS